MDTYNHQDGVLAEDLINTYDLFLEEPEHLQQPQDLQRFLEAHGLRFTAVTQADLEAVRVLRQSLREAWTAETASEMARILNDLVGQQTVTLQFEAPETQIHLHLSAGGHAAIVKQVAVRCALGIAEIQKQYGLSRMRACAAEPCRDVFIDVSRNNSRRFCSDRCANRYNISAFRERQKGGQ